MAERHPRRVGGPRGRSRRARQRHRGRTRNRPDREPDGLPPGDLGTRTDAADGHPRHALPAARRRAPAGGRGRARQFRRGAVPRREGGPPHRRGDRVLRHRPVRHARRDLDRRQPGAVHLRGVRLGRAGHRDRTRRPGGHRRHPHRRAGTQSRRLRRAVRRLHGPFARTRPRTVAARRLRSLSLVGHAVLEARRGRHDRALGHRRARRVVPAATGPGTHACDDAPRLRRELPPLRRGAAQLRPRHSRWNSSRTPPSHRERRPRTSARTAHSCIPSPARRTRP